jgi:hypothetical protein
MRALSTRFGSILQEINRNYVHSKDFSKKKNSFPGIRKALSRLFATFAFCNMSETQSRFASRGRAGKAACAKDMGACASSQMNQQ